MSKKKEDEDAELSRLKAENNNAEEAHGDAKRQFDSIRAELRQHLAIDSQ